MSLFDKMKKEKQSTPNATESEFQRDIRELLSREDIQSRVEICEEEFNKAQGLLNNPTNESIHRAYDLIGNLASQFDYLPAIMWMGNFSENVLHDLQQAVYWYKKAADLGDGNGSRCYADMLMTGNGVQQNVQLAIHYYADAADKGVPEAAFVLGEYLRNAGDKENAMKAYQQALNGGYLPAQVRIELINKSSPKESVPWRKNGEIRCSDWAERKCREGLCGVLHTDCPIMLQYDATHIVTRQPEEAAKKYKRALDIAPDYGRCWDGLASAYQFLGKLEDACEAQKKACELSPSCLTYGSMVRLLYLSGQFDEARKYLAEYKQYDSEGYAIEKKRLEEAEAASKKS